MKFDVDDKNRCRLVCVKFHLNRCRFAVAVAKCLGGLTFLGHSVQGRSRMTFRIDAKGVAAFCLALYCKFRVNGEI